MRCVLCSQQKILSLITDVKFNSKSLLYHSLRIPVLILYACYLFELELQNKYWRCFSFPIWWNLNETKASHPRKWLNRSLNPLCLTSKISSHWGLGCWHGYSNSCCSWQGRGAGRHKGWDESPCPSCISGGTAKRRLPEVAPQAADQVQVDSLHIVILSRAIHQLCAHKNQMLLVS